VCGIAGYVGKDGSEALDPRRLDNALAAITHRGPDGRGSYVAAGVELGNTRLSIIDVPGGAQPMYSEDESVVAVYNGEIWNYRELRRKLERSGHRFRTRSDTEVLVHGYEEWGDDLPRHLDGMFAFAVWDTRRRRLLLARDRLGKKPLYVLQTVEGLAFGSDARSLFLLTGTRPSVERAHVAEFLFRRYVLSPGTLFADVVRLEPGHRLVYEGDAPSTSAYWRLEVPATPEPLSATELRGLLERAVERRLMSDVPLGVMLSGGIDSAGIVALARRSVDALASFTVGFEDPVYDERPAARISAAHFDTDHHELALDTRSFFEALPRLSWFRDEPISEASEIPLLLLAEFAGRHVRVVLTGDGGDEVFGGYPKYRADLLLRAGRRPAGLALRGAIHLQARRRGHRQLERAAHGAGIQAPLDRWASWFQSLRPETIGEVIAPELAADATLTHFGAQLSRVLAPYEHVDAGRRMMLADLFTYLPDNMLARSDKVLMAASVEGRMPLLDVDVVTRVSASPSRDRVSLRSGKRVLKAALRDLLPLEIARLPKRGFPVPVERFLGDHSGSVLEGLVLSERALDRGLFRPDALTTLVRGGLGTRDLFVLASLELWLRANVDQVTTVPPTHDDLFEHSASRRPRPLEGVSTRVVAERPA
jgi:asparagine synthase (glutamine-hydrolysing)